MAAAATGHNPARSHGTEVVEGDLLRPAWADRALEGAETLVLISHGLYEPSRRNHPDSHDRVAVAHLIDAAARAGVRDVVLVRGTGGECDPTRGGV
jgi:uncharacterized protein YbjT (DUF2867 family)